jgi:hypothetical protein
MKKKKTQWQKLLDLIESTDINGVIHRSQVLGCVEKCPDAHRFYSVDSYRRILTVLNVLQKTSKSGCYKVISHIPEKKFSYSTARKLAYGRTTQ